MHTSTRDQASPIGSVSVVIPTFNRIRTVPLAIRSVLAQTLQPDRIFVVDDGSSDGTAAFIQREFPQITLLSLSSNAGAANARNAAISKISSDYVAFLDSDDVWLPDFLSHTVSALEKHQEAVIAVTDTLIRASSDAEPYTHHSEPRPGYDNLIHHLLLDNFITTMSTVTVRREAIHQAGLLDPDFWIIHDREWYLRLIRYGTITTVPEALVERNIGDDNLVGNMARYENDINLLGKKFFSAPENQDFIHLKPVYQEINNRNLGRLKSHKGLYAQAAQNYCQALFHHFMCHKKINKDYLMEIKTSCYRQLRKLVRP